MTDTDKYKLKHCHKINGILFEKRSISTHLTEFVIYKSGKTKKYIRFVTFDQETIEKLTNANPKDRLKVRFTVKSIQYTDRNNIKRWNTDLVAMFIDEWKKNEAKQQKQQKQQEMQYDGNYQRSLFTGETGSWTTKP